MKPARPVAVFAAADPRHRARRIDLARQRIDELVS
jgi:hypothetical protein